VNASGAADGRVLQLAYINAINQGGQKNSIDTAVIEAGSHSQKMEGFALGEKVGEISFKFETRRSSAIIRTEDKKLLLICKGAFEEVSALCTHIRVNDKVMQLDGSLRLELCQKASAFNADGHRVIIVATKELQQWEVDDADALDGLDADMVVEGLLTFLDPPKDDAAASVARLQELGVEVKVLTGDNLGVALKVCRTLNLVTAVDESEIQAISGPDLAQIVDKEEFSRVVSSCKIFAKLTPSQKGQIVMNLKDAGEVVGMLGDGINDCVALRFADVGISVDSGTKVAKDCADGMLSSISYALHHTDLQLVILTEKQLGIIVDSVTIGRITHGNTIKYIKMVASSNFGNVFSILIASAWLPFDPVCIESQC
jgi:P-type Mg2+ transporter